MIRGPLALLAAAHSPIADASPRGCWRAGLAGLLALFALCGFACESGGGSGGPSLSPTATATAIPDPHHETATPTLLRTPSATASPMPTAAPREAASAPPAADPAEAAIPAATDSSAPARTPQATPKPAATPTPTSTSCSGISCIEEAPGSFERRVWAPGEAVWDLQPPAIELLVLAPVLLVVSDGAADALVLYWTGGPGNASTWQYRTRGPWYGDRAAWGAWTDIPAREAATRSYRLTGLGEGMSYGIQVRGIVGEVPGAPSDSVWSEVPTFDSMGTPRIPLWRVIGGGRAWRVGATVVDIPARMRAFAGVHPPSDPGPFSDQIYIVDLESDSVMYVATDFGAECGRSISPSGAGRDIGALFDQIIASARVTLDALPALTTVTTGDRGVVSLEWFGAPDGVTHWEYRLRARYRHEGPWGEWTNIAESDADTRSHSVSGLPDGISVGFQVRAMAGSMAGAASHEVFGAPAVVGPDGIPQLHGYPQWGQGGRTWRLHDSATIVDVPVGLAVGASSPGHYSDGQVSVSEQSTGDWILVDVEAAAEIEFSGGRVAVVPPCGVWPAGHAQLFDRMRASLRLQPIVR